MKKIMYFLFCFYLLILLSCDIQNRQEYILNKSIFDVLSIEELNILNKHDSIGYEYYTEFKKYESDISLSYKGKFYDIKIKNYINYIKKANEYYYSVTDFNEIEVLLKNYDNKTYAFIITVFEGPNSSE